MKLLSLALLISGLLGKSYAQQVDYLRISVGTTTTAATKNYQPLWIAANRYGSISSQQADLSTFFALHNHHTLTRATTPDLPRVRWRAGYGVALYNHNHFDSTFLQEAYGTVAYSAWQLRAGRYRETTGTIDPTLSSGSFGISGNALPLPKVELAVTEYTMVPITNG